MSLPMLSPDLQVAPVFESGAAVASTTYTNLSDSVAQNLTLNAATRFVRISAENQGVYFKWSTGVAKTNNGWDGYIMAGQTFDFAVASVTNETINLTGRVLSVIGISAGANCYIAETN